MCVPIFILGLAKESVTSIELSLKVNVTSIELSLKVNWHDAISTCWPDARNSVSNTARTLLRLNIVLDRLLWGRVNFIYFQQAIWDAFVLNSLR